MTGSVAVCALMWNLQHEGNSVELPSVCNAVCTKQASERAKGGGLEITRESIAVGMGGEHMWV